MRPSIITVLAALALAWAVHAQCTAGTVASYAGQTFSAGGVTYTFPTNDYVFSGTNVPPIPASAMTMRPDSSGANTILFGCTNWSLDLPNESLRMQSGVLVAARSEGMILRGMSGEPGRIHCH
ncbi:MAG: hypothetical protein KGJ60_01755 [Verrucomicrobiota bacterium]|nr:hypothetical protein [Verrucomicrobiota bacterium]